MTWVVPLLVRAQESVDVSGIPFGWLLGPVGLTAYLLWDNHRLREDLKAERADNKELDKEGREMAKSAIAALKKAGERE